jgi:hypothetical protein
VLASVLGVAIGIYAGFTIAILLGAAFYSLALFTAGRLPGAVPPAPVENTPPPPPPLSGPKFEDVGPQIS